MASITSVGYKIEIGEKALHALNILLKKKKYSKYFILCDENTLLNCLPALINRCLALKDSEIFEIESGESSKDLAVCSHLWQSLLEHKADKNSLIINLGGGVVSDIGGFVASVYKRGIDFINVPTSLLAMADASVGGKTGIDLAGGKNMIGTITQPKGVFIYPGFLNTLPDKHFKNGMAEIFKIALISDKTFWIRLIRKPISGSEELIAKSVELKNKFVKKDPSEKNIRKALNFGHTVGHAVEGHSLETSRPLLHGEAVAIGMIVETHLSYQQKLISKKVMDEIILTLINYFELNPLTPTSFDDLLNRMANDKKNSGNKINFTLLSAIGKYKINIAVESTRIKNSLQFFNSLFK